MTGQAATPDPLQAVIAATVAEVLLQLGNHPPPADQSGGPTGNFTMPAGRLALSEAEASMSLGVPRHVLRDARRRGEVSARKVGKSYRYTREGLLDYLDNRTESKKRRAK